jgi:tellurite resistance protein
LITLVAYNANIQSFLGKNRTRRFNDRRFSLPLLAMTRTSQFRSNQLVSHIFHRIGSSGQLTRQEYLQLVTLLLANQKLSEFDRRKINQVFDQVQAGELRLIE